MVEWLSGFKGYLAMATIAAPVRGPLIGVLIQLAIGGMGAAVGTYVTVQVMQADFAALKESMAEFKAEMRVDWEHQRSIDSRQDTQMLELERRKADRRP